MTREEQKEQRRKEILERSIDLFISKGYASTKVSDIADEVKMSVGLLFHYFSSKEALYEELIDIALAGTASVMCIDLKSSLGFFETAADAILSLPATDMFAVKLFVLMGRARNNAALPDRIRDKVSQVNNIGQCAQLIRKGQAEGTIRQGDPLALSMCFWCAIQGVMETLALNPDCPIPESQWLISILKK